MRSFSVFAGIFAFAACVCAQRNGYTNITTVDEFVARLNTNSIIESKIRTILNSSQARSNGIGADTTANARLACEVTRLVFGSKLYSQQSKTYPDLADNNWSMTCWLSPKCIFQPESAMEVSKAMLITSFLGSQFAVRSGGHNPNVGFSNVGSEGVLFDLSKLNDVSLTSDGNHVSIGPGNRWGRVYQILASSGKMVIGGRANDIGVGGLLLGGGLSYWSSIHGMAFNKIVNYEVVLGDSSIVNANQTHNRDLWWALRGGGANYGIVTRFDVETVENSSIWFEGLLIDPNEQEALLKVAIDFVAAAENDPNASATYNMGPTGGAVYLAYNNPTERPEIFKRFYEVSHQTIINSTIGTWVDYHNAVSDLNPFGALRIAISVYDREWDFATLLDHYKRYTNASAQVQDQLNATMYFVPQMFSKHAVQTTLEKGGSPLNISEKTHCFLEIMITWTDARFDQDAAQRLQSFGQEIDIEAQGRGTNLNFYYMNDAGSFQNVLKSYGSLEKMRSVSQAYDPFQVFQRLQHNGFLLSDA
ncbi:FAD-binding domain-containing protein [Periconia macrospinosa]|uniref:FAD-binding domain-containing protein n=1 Tax=Periconia macrospinosa TaxID=97972 RepID=A0A2V1E922_9PLEO|nr:FAD-binding domain-containing protein [Periconia macrospinosa]